MEKERTDSYSHVLKYISVFGGVQGLNIIISLVRNKAIAWLLGPAGMGLASLFNSVVNFISQSTNLGISFSAVRHVSELFDQGDTQRTTHFIKVVRGWSLLTALLGMLVCVMAGPLLSQFTFSWGDHTLHFVLLAPAVGMMAVTGGETAIMKGARCLKPLAIVQVLTMGAALLISLPLYWLFGQKGIVPVIVLMALAAMLITLRYSHRRFPYSLRGTSGIFGEGMDMVRLGVAYVLAAILGSASEMFIRSYLNVAGNLDLVGLYNAGFMLTMTYGGLVFSAMETDYFPRLSAVGDDLVRLRDTVNRQTEVTLLIISPMLVGLIVFIPLLIPLLFSSEFLPVVGMTQVVLVSMYFRAIYLPIGYIPLAKGDSWQFLCLETLSYAILVGLVIAGYQTCGLLGTGFAIALANVADILVVYVYARVKYHYAVSSGVLSYLAIQMPIGLVAWLLSLGSSPVLYWLAGVLLTVVSSAVSVYLLHQKTALWNTLITKFLRHFRKD